MNRDFIRLRVCLNLACRDRIEVEHGEAGELDVPPRQVLAVLSSRVDGVSASDIVQDFGIETTRDFFARAGHRC